MVEKGKGPWQRNIIMILNIFILFIFIGGEGGEVLVTMAAPFITY